MIFHAYHLPAVPAFHSNHVKARNRVEGEGNAFSKGDGSPKLSDPEVTSLLSSLGEIPIFIVDIETTGIDHQVHALCEIAALRWLPPNYTGDAKRTIWSTLVHPGMRIPKSASAVHGITDEDVASAPTAIEAIRELRAVIPKNALVLAHNVGFEARFIPIDGWHHACTIKLARVAWPDAPSYANMKLARWLGIDLDGVRAHRAVADAAVTGMIFHKLLKAFHARDGMLPNLEDLLAWSNRRAGPVRMPMGKYRDKAVTEVPVDYLQWALEAWTEIDQDVRRAMRNVLETACCQNSLKAV